MATKYVVGSTFTNNQGYEAVIISKVGQRVRIRFLVSGSEREVDTGDLGRGRFKDKYAPSVYGIGVVGDNTTQTPAYKQWVRMLERCYSGRHNSYCNTTVCSSWLTLDNFITWYDKNHIEGWHLDKDLKQVGLDSKVYSASTCIYLPPSVNCALVNPNSSGVTVRGASFISQIKRFNKTFNLGTYTSFEEATSIYKIARLTYLKELALLYKENGISDLLVAYANHYFKE